MYNAWTLADKNVFIGYRAAFSNAGGGQETNTYTEMWVLETRLVTTSRVVKVTSWLGTVLDLPSHRRTKRPAGL